MASSSVSARPLLLVLSALLAFEACSSGDKSNYAPSPSAGNGGSAGGGGTNVIMPDTSTPLSGEGGATTLNPLCGIDSCNPDDQESCANYVPSGGAPQLQLAHLGGAGGSGAAGLPGSSGQASGAGGSGDEVGESEAGAGGLASRGAAGAGEGAAAPTGGLGPVGANAGGSAGAQGESPAYACRVATWRGEPQAACAASGRGDRGDPCFSSRECVAGLGCVNDGVLGRCRPFCCGGENSCNAFAGSFCAERELLEEPVSVRSLRVPVCIPAENCDLNQAPCDSPGECECPPESACQVVRPDGTTACAPQGRGTSGLPCPCRYGYVCSRAANTCLALCRTRGDAGGVPCKLCQGSAELPDGWGVCID